VTVLETLLDAWQEQLADTVYANKLDPVLELRLRSRLCVPPIYPWALVGIDAAMDLQDKSRPRLRSALR
jgi:hypothetical protein